MLVGCCSLCVVSWLSVVVRSSLFVVFVIVAVWLVGVLCLSYGCSLFCVVMYWLLRDVC